MSRQQAVSEFASEQAKHLSKSIQTLNMKLVFLFSSLLICVAASGYGGGDGDGGHGGGHDDSHDYYAPAHYNFGYDVTDKKSYVSMGHNEDRKGDTTKGAFYVHLPDGRLQKTEYMVSGKSGFVPKVSYHQTGAAYGSTGGGYGGGHGDGGSSGKGY